VATAGAQSWALRERHSLLSQKEPSDESDSFHFPACAMSAANPPSHNLGDLQPCNLSTHSGCWALRLTHSRARAAPFHLSVLGVRDAEWQGCEGRALLIQLSSAASRTRLLRTRLLRSRRCPLLPRRPLPSCAPLTLPFPPTSPVPVVPHPPPPLLLPPRPPLYRPTLSPT